MRFALCGCRDAQEAQLVAASRKRKAPDEEGSADAKRSDVAGGHAAVAGGKAGDAATGNSTMATAPAGDASTADMPATKQAKLADNEAKGV
jgi:hypothetical protein